MLTTSLAMPSSQVTCWLLWVRATCTRSAQKSRVIWQSSRRWHDAAKRGANKKKAPYSKLSFMSRWTATPRSCVVGRRSIGWSRIPLKRFQESSNTAETVAFRNASLEEVLTYWLGMAAYVAQLFTTLEVISLKSALRAMWSYQEWVRGLKR